MYVFKRALVALTVGLDAPCHQVLQLCSLIMGKVAPVSIFMGTSTWLIFSMTWIGAELLVDAWYIAYSVASSLTLFT